MLKEGERMLHLKIWNQANDGATMGLRVVDVVELEYLSGMFFGPSDDGNWASLRDYLDYMSSTDEPPAPFVITADVYWDRPSPSVPYPLARDRRFEFTYTGNRRESGGYAVQGYLILPTDWAPGLLSSHMTPVDAELSDAGPVPTVTVL